MGFFRHQYDIIAKEQHYFWSHHYFRLSTLLGFIFLSLSLVINYLAGRYAASHVSNAVRDILLDHLPVLDVRLIFIDGIILFFIFIILLQLYRPQSMPFVLKSISLFVVIRAFFVTLTHLAPAVSYSMYANHGIVSKFTFGGDLFFSGHTGLPFLMALIFWREPILRSLFLVLSFIFATAVLVGHLHYSIDVFAAFFITYTIFHIAAILFLRDYHILILSKWLRIFSRAV